MSDYTPTTDEVRDYYLQAGEDWGDGLLKAAGEFDRWLAKYTRELHEEAYVSGYYKGFSDGGINNFDLVIPDVKDTP